MFELLLITDPDAPRGLVGSVEAALQGADGVRLAVQLRAKQMSLPALLPIARELRELTQRAGARLFINGRLELAREVGADGVQLPETGLTPRAARALLGPGPLIGASCHDPIGLARAAQGGASFATVSPVFHSPGKGPAIGSARFADWARAAQLPVFALGGIRAEHAALLRRKGARGLAVISSVFYAHDPAAAVRDLLSAWHGAAASVADRA